MELQRQQKEKQIEVAREYKKKSLVSYDGNDKVISSFQAREIINSKKKEIKPLLSGFKSLDYIIKGFYPGELTVLSGLTGNGKTLLAQTLTQNFSLAKRHSVWFSYEVSIRQFLEQMEDDEGVLSVFYVPSILKSSHISWIRDRIIEAQVKFNVEAVFIDHLHFLSDVMMRRNPSLEIGQIMRQINLLAIELQIAIFLIAHTTKIKSDVELGLGDVRDSSFIEQEASNVFYIWRRNATMGKDNQAVIKIAKNRRFGVRNLKINIEKIGNKLVEVEKN